MNYVLLIIIALVGTGLGYYFSSRGTRNGIDLIAQQSQEKKENKQKILDFLREEGNPDASGRGRIKNNDVEKLVGVSNATAERYLDELEREGKIIQHGKIGRSVFYTLK